MKKLTFRVQLEGIRPSIWREFQVPSVMSAEDFAVNIQIVMGWTYSHLYGFQVGNIEYWNGEFMDDSPELEFVHAYDEMTIEDLFSSGEPVTFIYDFGDHWKHSLKILHTEDYVKGERKCAKILGGARCCPPEDVGGVYGYQQMLQILKKSPRSEEAQSYLTWLGGSFNPERFNIRKITSDLAYYRIRNRFPGSEEDDYYF